MAVLSTLIITCGLTINCANCDKKNLANDISNSEQDTNDVITITQNETYNNTRNYSDVFEPNDNPSTATNLSPTNYYLEDYYENNISATLECEYLMDTDYFYFKVFSNSSITVSLETVNSSMVPTFSVLRDNYFFSSTTNSFTENFSYIYTDYTSSTLKTFTSSQMPGTFLIKINRENQQQYYGDINYNISLEVTVETDSESHLIGDLYYNKNLQGAYWGRDFIPAQHEEGFYKQKNLQYSGTGNGYYDANYAVFDLHNLISNNNYLVEEYYLWGSEIKEAVAEILQVIVDAFFDEVQYNANLTREIQITRDNYNNTISIICFVAGSVVKNQIVSIAADAIGFISQLIINGYFDSMIPDVGVSDYYYSHVLGYYLGLLNNSSPDEIIYMPVYCSLSYDTSGAYTNYYFTTKNTSEIIYNTSNYLWNSDTISTYNKGYSYLKGSLYAFSSNGEKTSISEFQNIVPTPSQFEYLGNYFSVYYTGGYEWLQFNPLANTNYYFYFKSSATEDFYVETFNSVVAGYSTSGRIHCYVVNGTEISTNNKVVFFNLSFNSTSPLFFRIQGYGHASLTCIQYGMGDISNYINHIHVHEDCYVWKNYYNHDAFCVCGHSVTQGHVVSSKSLNEINAGGGNYQTCLLCGGQASTGFIHGKSNAVSHTENGSFINEDGIMVLEDSDLELFYNGALVFIEDSCYE